MKGFAITVAILILAVGAAATAGTVRAQTTAPQFLVTWKTSGSYVPAAYPDKALPTYGSTITASLELLLGGKPVDLRYQTIYWYLNDVLIGGGLGVQTVSFPPFNSPPSSLTLNVTLPSYQGAYLSHDITIPFVSPVAVINAPYPNGQAAANPVSVSALPYFFNTASASSLSYAWSVNGQAGASAENPQTANINLPASTAAGTVLSVGLTITNPGDSTSGAGSLNLTYAPHL